MGHGETEMPSPHQLFENPPDLFIQHVTIAFVLCFVNIILSIIYIFRMFTRLENAKLRNLYVFVAMFGCFNAIVGVITVVVMESHGALELVRTIYEAGVLASFLKIMVSLGGEEEKLISLAQTQAPRNWYRTPPCGPCCFWRKSTHFNHSILKYAKTGVNQFLICIIVISIISLSIYYEGIASENMTTYNNAYPALHAIEIASMLYSLHGVFIIYYAVRGPLSHFHPGKKFIAIKLLIFLGIFHDLIIKICVKSGALTGAYLEMGTEAAVVHWQSYLLVIESFIVSVMLFSVFSPNELVQFIATRSDTEIVLNL